MPRYQGSAYILKKWDVGESDQLVSFIVADRGRLKGIAKGAKRSKKRFGGLLSPFVLVQIDYFEKPGRDLVRIEGCSFIYYYSSIYTDLEKLLVGCSLLEMMERVLPEQFIRIHRSYIVDVREVQSYHHKQGGVYQVTLKDNRHLPLGRKYIADLKNLLIR